MDCVLLQTNLNHMVKPIFIVLLLLVIGQVAYSQESAVSLNAGYLFSSDRMNDQQGSGNGWRLIATYQQSLKNEKWAIGISAGLMKDRYSFTLANPEFPEVELESIPIFFSGQYFMGKKQWRGYLKGSAGVNWVVDYKMGFLSGLGIGVNHPIHEKLFINAEYEFNLWQNDFYGIRYLQSANVGIGFKF